MRLTRVCNSVLCSIFALLIPPLTTPGATVNVCDDASLRSAISAGGTVNIGCDGVIQLTNTLAIHQNVVIDGTGHQVVLSGSNAVRLLYVYPGARLTLRNLTLADGLARGANGIPGQPGESGEGGAIYNEGGIIDAIGCSFSNNRAQGGTGGIPPQFGPGGLGGQARGGAIFNTSIGNVSASDCEFRLNHALGGNGGYGGSSGNTGGDAAGGAFFNVGGSLSLTNCVMVSNRVVGGQGRRQGGSVGQSGKAYGGAIANSGGTVFGARASMFGNTSASDYMSHVYGGAVHSFSGALSFADSWFSNNSASAGRGLVFATLFGFPGGSAYGGGVSAESGTVTFNNATFSDNCAIGGRDSGGGAPAGSAFGGTIYLSGTAMITNSTFANNQALSGTARFDTFQSLYGSALGGGIHNSGGAFTLSHVTMSGNTAAHNGDGAYGRFFGGSVFSTNGTTTLVGSIVANSPSGSNCFGTIIDGGKNISSDGSCNLTGPGSLNNTDPLLGPLADYGGSIPTMALLNGSPAIDAANSGNCPVADQRGVARPFGGACDIGAFESSPPYTILGKITGFTAPISGMEISAGASTAPVPKSGAYALHGLTAGSQLVTPSSPEAVFVLSNRVVDVVRDTIGVDFHSYRSNALVIEGIGTGATKSIFAGDAGQIYHVEVSTEFQGWTPYSTNTTASSGLFEFNDTNTVLLSPRLFRVLRP